MMSKEEIAKIIADYFAGKPVLRAYLFGSFARGDADEKSDVDVLVEFDRKAGEVGLFEHFEMQEGLEHAVGRKVDLVSTAGLSPRVAPYVHADKTLVYERAD